MTADSDQPITDLPDVDQPYVDPQSLADRDLHVYEAIVTLEYLGRPVTRSEIAGAAGLDGPELDGLLGDLTKRHLLVQSPGSGEPAFAPAQRGWSAVPGEAAGPQRLT
jgi:hypothetical protein